MMKLTILKEPSAFLPLAMSLGSIAMVVVHYAMYGIVQEADEGTPAHVFQLLMVAQVPFGLYFAVKWLPRARGPALVVLTLQGCAMLGAFASVFFLTSG